MAEQAKQPKKRTGFLTMLVILVLLTLVGAELIHIRVQITAAQEQQALLQSRLDEARQENDALSSALEKADDPEFLQELARDQLGYVTPGEKSFYDVSN
ncbi:MAG: septum formation initiator family protein [Oscillospiraceae bacterium]|nr:septum formation initiator family protein [Oscillospiraceae bacterium]